jgi:hypothetical protein
MLLGKVSRTPSEESRAGVGRRLDGGGETSHVALMGADFPLCQMLPPPRPGLDWRALHAFRTGDRGGAFYVACLEYAQALWQRGLAARAILCLDRAFGADLRGNEPELERWPLPYAAMAWFIRHVPAGVFIGNPRVHFQHYADRMNEPRREQRRWRAWACWAIVRRVRLDLAADPRHRVVEPTVQEIEAQLRRHGFAGEAELWQVVVDESVPAGPICAA